MYYSTSLETARDYADRLTTAGQDPTVLGVNADVYEAMCSGTGTPWTPSTWPSTSMNPVFPPNQEQMEDWQAYGPSATPVPSDADLIANMALTPDIQRMPTSYVQPTGPHRDPADMDDWEDGDVEWAYRTGHDVPPSQVAGLGPVGRLLDRQQKIDARMAAVAAQADENESSEKSTEEAQH